MNFFMDAATKILSKKDVLIKITEDHPFEMLLNEQCFFIRRVLLWDWECTRILYSLEFLSHLNIEATIKTIKLVKSGDASIALAVDKVKLELAMKIKMRFLAVCLQVKSKASLWKKHATAVLVHFHHNKIRRATISWRKALMNWVPEKYWAIWLTSTHSQTHYSSLSKLQTLSSSTMT